MPAVKIESTGFTESFEDSGIELLALPELKAQDESISASPVERAVAVVGA